MKKLVYIVIAFVAMTLHVQANTVVKNKPVGEDIAAGTPVVIELGTRVLRAGLSTAAAPTVTLSHNFATFAGTITNWTAFENTLSQAFNQLGINPANHPVLISEPPLHSKTSREKVAAVLFNKFKVPSLYMANDAQLALYASDNTTGVVVHVHGSGTSIASVYNGYLLPESVMHMELGEDDLANYMKSLLQNKGYTVSDEDAAAITRNLGYVAYDYNAELAKSPAGITKSYQLAGGQTISVDRERFKVPELLVQPAFIGMNSAGIHEHTYNSIMRCDVGVRNELYANIVLAGSGTLIPGMKERIQKEVIALAPPATKITVKAQANREYLAWTGGKKLAALLTGNMWLSKAVFDDKGASVVHTRFF